MKNQDKRTSEEKITRQEALKKAGRYAAFTAAASILFLTPLKADPTSMGNGYGGSPVNPPGGGNTTGGKKTTRGQQKPAAPPSSGGLKKTPWE